MSSGCGMVNGWWAGIGRHGGAERRQLVLGQELGDRAVEPLRRDPHPHEALGAPALRLVGQLVEPPAGELGPARHPDALDARRLERLEPGRGEHRRQLDQLHPEAGVGLVGAVALGRLLPGHAAERRRVDVDAGDRLRAGAHGLVDEGDDLGLADEAGLHVELGELELAVGTQVLVAQAAGDLVVAVDAAHHAQLLEELWALGQGVEGAGLLPRRDHEVAGALGRRRNQHGRLDLGETLALHRRADGAVRLRPGAQVALQAVAAQVDVAVAQADGLVGLDPVVEGEGRRLGRVEDLDLALAHLDLAGGQAVVDRALGAGPDRAGDAHDPLGAGLDRPVDHALDDALAVAQVDERELVAVLAAARHPAAQRDPFADVGGAELAAPVRAQPGGGGTRLGGLAHDPSRILRTRVTTSVRGTSCCSAWRRSRTAAVPLAASDSPTITATGAPARPAALICDLMDRPSNARSARRPAPRSSAVRSRAADPSVTSTTKASSVTSGAANTPSASQASSIRSMPDPNPMPGVG